MTMKESKAEIRGHMREAESLRAIVDTLDCPIPPFAEIQMNCNVALFAESARREAR